MGPNFEVYVSLLAGSWMPWLDRNRECAEFDYLLEALWPHTGGTPDEFFRALAPLLRNSRWTQPKKFMHEVEQLAGVQSEGGQPLAAEFLRLPASGSREQFYNVLTGFSLAGYDTWAGKLVQPGQYTNMGVYFRERLLNTLRNLMRLPVAVPEASTGDRVIAFRVKAALLTLCHRLQGRQGLGWHTACRVIPVREELRACLAESPLDEATGLQIVHLLDALTGEKPPVQLSAAAPIRNTPAVPAAPEGNDPDIAKLTHLVMESGSEIQQLKQELEKFLLNENAPASKAAPKSNRRLDSVAALRILSVSKTSLQRYRQNGTLPFAKVGGKYTYLESDVLKLIEDGKKLNNSGKGKFRKPE